MCVNTYILFSEIERLTDPKTEKQNVHCTNVCLFMCSLGEVYKKAFTDEWLCRRGCAESLYMEIVWAWIMIISYNEHNKMCMCFG